MKVNEYFDGQVKSISYHTGDQNASVGVMEAGSYQFNTGAPEVMRVITGALTIRLAGEMDWVTYTAGQAFDVPGDSSFDVKVESSTSYLCTYG